MTLEELGFKKEHSSIPDVLTYCRENRHRGDTIDFWLKSKQITTSTSDYDYMESYDLFINMELLEAITNKCKELGWIEMENK